MSVIIWVLLGVVVIWALATLYYAPLSIELKDNVLAVNRSLRIKEIPLSEIKMVKLCPPTMAARRLFGSGGYFGYWGWFSEPDLGKYFAYYG
ncbi:MAG: PH domain-containing protein, partial [Muribaculaceae bacterium]|nr:PH domain-containing protein [Muribaculaceae bacterium]